MSKLSEGLFPSSEKICKKCNTALEDLFYGHSCFTEVHIYQMILSSVYNCSDSVCSNYVADVLHLDHEEVLQAMRELHRANDSAFELEDDVDNKPPVITQAGRSLLEQPLISLAENGLFYNTFLEFYPREIINLATTNQWIQTEIREDIRQMFVIPGPNRVSCESVCTLLHRVDYNLNLTMYEIHLLLSYGLISPGPIFPILLFKPGMNFPSTVGEVNQIWLKMVDLHIKSENQKKSTKQ